MKVETESEDAALDCSLSSRTAEKHPLDSVFSALQVSSKRRQLGSDSQLDCVTSVKRRRLIPEVRAQPLPCLPRLWRPPRTQACSVPTPPCEEGSSELPSAWLQSPGDVSQEISASL